MCISAGKDMEILHTTRNLLIGLVGKILYRICRRNVVEYNPTLIFWRGLLC